MSIKSYIRSHIPENLLLRYHGIKSNLAAQFSGHPSREMLMIGITGTKGKSTTANFLWAALQASGMQTGLIGTANIRIGDLDLPNIWHMTMPSPFILQKLFKKMKTHGCQAVVMEVTSEGIKQHREKNIDFDIVAFTNLSPEHLPSHNNSFEEYKNTKKKFFLELAENETISGEKKSIFVNTGSEYAKFFLDTNVSNKTTFELTSGIKDNIDYQAEITEISDTKTDFMVSEISEKESQKHHYSIAIGGTKNVENALLAVAIARHLNISPQNIQAGFNALTIIPGRMEKISIRKNDQKFPEHFSIFVDYAHEEQSMNFLMETGKKMQSQKKNSGRIIVLLGAEGGGRDPQKRPIMGKIVADNADIVVVSNVDPYEDNPTEIAEDIARAAELSGKKRGENLFVIEDRQSGIKKCLEIARENDIVFITGKGSEQSIVIEGISHPWDDRKVVRQLLKNL